MYGIVCFMSRDGDCWDNAAMESFTTRPSSIASISATIKPAMRQIKICSTTVRDAIRISASPGQSGHGANVDIWEKHIYSSAIPADFIGQGIGGLKNVGERRQGVPQVGGHRGRLGVAPFTGATNTCVIACSRETKLRGIKSVMSVIPRLG